MNSQEKREQIIKMINDIKRHSDRLAERPHMSILEVSVILAKITKLHEKTAILRYLLVKEQGNSEDSVTTHEIEALEAALDAEIQEVEEEIVNTEEVAEAIQVPENDDIEEEEAVNKDDSNEETEEQIESITPDLNLETDHSFSEDLSEGVQNTSFKVETQEDSNNEESFELPDLKDLGLEEEISTKPDLNEQYSEAEDNSVSEQLQKQPISDLIGTIGLNERYLYANELFDGNMEDFKKELEILNQFSSNKEALSYFKNELVSTYDWSLENELVMALLNLVQRRYQ